MQTQYKQHLDEQYADRAVDARLNTQSEQSCASGCALGARILKIDIDGMDQSKFKCPRAPAASKQFEDLHKPALHVTGVIVHGVAEFYYYGDADIRKDSNAQSTLIGMVLDEVNEIRKASPHTLPSGPHGATQFNRLQSKGSAAVALAPDVSGTLGRGGAFIEIPTFE